MADGQALPPRYALPGKAPSLLSMMRHAMSDPAAVIPAAILHDWALKLPTPAGPVVIAHPDDVRAVMLDKGERFGRNRQLSLMMKRAWGAGLAAAEGASWAAQRRAVVPAFRPDAVAAAVPAMRAVAKSVAARWQDGPVELSGAIGRIVIDIVLTTLLSGLDDVDIDALAQDIPHYVRDAATFGLLDSLPLSDARIDSLRGAGRSKESAHLRDFATRLAAARASPPDARIDLPALLRGIGPLADNIRGFVAAGYETSALAAAWAIYLLANYQEWQDAVRAEALDATDDTTMLPMARQVAQEALRLYPPAPLLVRAAMVPTDVRGFKLRAGQAVIIPVYAIHRHRQLWDQPDAFLPERFAEGADYHRGAYLPFGAGPRLCVAASFALTEIAVIVSQLVRQCRFAPALPAAQLSLKTISHSTTGLNVTMTRL